jgi:hypothetical protein
MTLIHSLPVTFSPTHSDSLHTGSRYISFRPKWWPFQGAVSHHIQNQDLQSSIYRTLLYPLYSHSTAHLCLSTFAVVHQIHDPHLIEERRHWAPSLQFIICSDRSSYFTSILWLYHGVFFFNFIYMWNYCSHWHHHFRHAARAAKHQTCHEYQL